MKKIKHISKLLFLLALLLSACESWLDVNENPNAPVEVSYEELLPAGISSVAYVVGGKYQVLGAMWSQHWTQSPGASQYAGVDAYDINSSTYDARQFGELYSGALKNLEEVRVRSKADGEYKYYFIATVMQCYTFQVLTDLYGQIPFSEALQGDEEIAEPIYEQGRNVYDSLITRLDFALSLDFENKELKDPEEKDLLFNGDMSKWEEFANTLKLRIYMRQTEVSPEKARQGIQNLYDTDASFLSNNVALEVFTNESGRRNPLYDTEVFAFGGNPNLILSNTLYSFLVDNADFTSLDYLFNRPSGGGEHKALIQGDYYAPGEVSGINSSSYSKPVMSADFPVYLMTVSEALLLQSEAIIRFNFDDYSEARTLYEEAIVEYYDRIMVGVSNTDVQTAAARLIGGAYSFPSEGTDEEKFIERIALQKWVCLSGVSNMETFFELNRTGYPKKSDVPASNSNYVDGELTVSVNNVTSGKFPKRLIFPESEYANNRNTPALKEVWENIWWDISFSN